jgi:hypothetical protein
LMIGNDRERSSVVSACEHVASCTRYHARLIINNEGIALAAWRLFSSRLSADK